MSQTRAPLQPIALLPALAEIASALTLRGIPVVVLPAFRAEDNIAGFSHPGMNFLVSSPVTFKDRGTFGNGRIFDFGDSVDGRRRWSR